MSRRSTAQCPPALFSENTAKSGTTKTNYSLQSHVSPVSTIAGTLPVAKNTFTQGSEEITNVTSHLLKQAARRISWVHTPLIVAGSDTLKRKVRKNLIEFATCLEIPIASTTAAKESISNAHPLWLGTISSPQVYSCYGFDWADLVIVVGCNATECASEYWNPDGDIPILHISSSSAIKSAHYQPTLELVGNLSYLLEDLSRRSNRQGKRVSYPLELRALNQDNI